MKTARYVALTAVALLLSAPFSASSATATKKTKKQKPAATASATGGIVVARLSNGKTASTPAAAPAAAPDSPLVAAARSAPVKRDRATMKIDNEAVRHSTGKLSSPASAPPPIPNPVASGSGRAEEFDRALASWKKDVARNGERIETLTREIADLKNLLGRFEEDFYDEDDPGYRDVLEQKYDRSAERLKAAQEELEQAREEASALQKSRPRLD